MLGIMRKYKQSILIKIVFVLIVLSFIGTIFLVWGKGDGGSTPEGYAAKVNGTVIGLDDFQRSYDRTRRIYEQLYQSSLTPEMEKQMGLKKLTMESLIDQALVRQAGKKMGIKVSDREVEAAIAQVPQFQQDGAFDYELYQQTLKANRITPRDFEGAQKDELLINKTRNKIKDQVKLTDQDLLQAYKKQNDKVALQYVAYSPAEVRGEVKLSDQELTTYLQNNEARFKTPEAVKIAYLLLSPERLAGKVAVTDEEALAFYQKNRDRYQGKEGILPFDEVKEQAKADALDQKAGKEAYEKAADAANRFRGNGDLKGAAAALGANVAETASFTAAAPPAELAGETELLQRAFILKQGELGGPVETKKGIYLVKVLEKRPPTVPPLAQIKEAVTKAATDAKAVELAQKKATDALQALSRGTAAGTKETAGFSYDPAGTVPGIGASPELMEEAFALTSAKPVAAKPYQIGNSWYAVKLKSRSEAPVTDFAAKKESLRQTELPRKQQEALEAWLKDLKGKAKIDRNQALIAE